MSHPTVDQASKQNLVVNIQDSEFGKLVVSWRERDKNLKKYKPDCPTAALGLAKEFCMALITSSLLFVFCNVSLIDMDIINS